MRIRERAIRRPLSVLLLSAGGLVALTALPGAASAQASAPRSVTPAYCAYPSWGNPDDGGGRTRSDGVKMHTGPYAACAVRLTMGIYTGLYWHCSTTNIYGNTWVHARMKGTSYQGWIYEGDLSTESGHDFPSVKAC